MLKEVSFGYHYFSMAMLFRVSILINGMLCSSEALHGITNAYVEQLETCDKMLFRNILNSFHTNIDELELEIFWQFHHKNPLSFSMVSLMLTFLPSLKNLTV